MFLAADAAVEYLNSVGGLVRAIATALQVGCVKGRGWLSGSVVNGGKGRAREGRHRTVC